MTITEIIDRVMDGTMMDNAIIEESAGNIDAIIEDIDALCNEYCTKALKGLWDDGRGEHTETIYSRLLSALSVLTEYKRNTPVNEPQQEQEHQAKTPQRRKKTFRDIVQYGETEDDKTKLIRRLHVLIDGQSGAAVGAVLLNAFHINPYLREIPTKSVYESEFGLIGSWSAIRKYLNDNDNTALAKANKVVIF